MEVRDSCHLSYRDSGLPWLHNTPAFVDSLPGQALGKEGRIKKPAQLVCNEFNRVK